MVDHDPQIGDLVGDPEQLLHLPRAAAKIEGQSRIGECLKVGHDLRLLEQLLHVPAPEIRKADADIERVLVQPGEMLAEIRMAGKQVADLAHHDRLLGGHVQNPVIVFHPGTAFGLDHADHAVGFGDLAVVRG